jgi:hypothetical protein
LASDWDIVDRFTYLPFGWPIVPERRQESLQKSPTQAPLPPGLVWHPGSNRSRLDDTSQPRRAFDLAGWTCRIGERSHRKRQREQQAGSVMQSLAAKGTNIIQRVCFGVFFD